MYCLFGQKFCITVCDLVNVFADVSLQRTMIAQIWPLQMDLKSSGALGLIMQEMDNKRDSETKPFLYAA